jgi:4-hydroxy-tetrahydrodipicolinate reductase
MLRVCVSGAAGRMGRSVVAAVGAEEDMQVAARVDPVLAGEPACFRDLPAALAAGGIDVLVDFTRPEAVFDNAHAALVAGVHAVVGTTGLSAEQVEDLRALAEAGPANIVIAPNFAVGAVLMMRFAAEASRHMPRAEIVELHHDGKLDAPSGTALRTAAMMEGEVPIHSVRLPGLVAHQEVILGGLGETLTIRHDSLSREGFMPGVVMALRAVADRPGLTMGLEPILFAED